MTKPELFTLWTLCLLLITATAAIIHAAPNVQEFDGGNTVERNEFGHRIKEPQ